MFYAATNLGHTAVSPCPAPWDFKIEKEIPAQIRGDKESRQEWYSAFDTVHNFYSAFEGVNPGQRVSKENPPHCLRGFVADFDIKMSKERILEAIDKMPIKPSYFENSLGNQWRLVWLCRVVSLGGNYEYATLLQKMARELLRLDLLPALDGPAFEAPSRLYANGGIWESTGAPAIPETKLQAFLVRVGKKFLFKAGDSTQIPIAEAEKALRAKFPGFDWPSEFAVGSQGPSFWIPESASPMSAIVKEGGIFTFSAHAEKPFYSWADLLGKEFVKDFLEASISSATSGIYFDSQNYWRLTPSGLFVHENDKGMDLHLTVTARMSTKSDSTGTSPRDQALEHIRKFQRVEGVAPFAFQKSGLLTLDGLQYINTYNRKPIQPSGETELWGKNFPGMGRHYDWLFTPKGEEQLEHFLCWWKILYGSALFLKPTSGQNIIMRGGPGVGKTWSGRQNVGYSIGGSIDVSDFLVKGKAFNGTYFDYGLWSLDDDSPTDGTHAVRSIHAQLKKIAANDDFVWEQKYRRSCKTLWNGRVFITTNLDMASGRLVQFEEGSNDKLNLYSVRPDVGDFIFPDRADMLAIRDREMPHFLQYLIDLKIPEKFADPKRWGIISYQDDKLMNLTRQSSPSATFKEVLLDCLHAFFTQHPTAEKWTGPVAKLQMLMSSNPLVQETLRSVKMDQTARHLEVIQNEHSIPMHVETGSRNVRLWTFLRKDFVTELETTLKPMCSTEDMTAGNFQAPTQADVSPE